MSPTLKSLLFVSLIILAGCILTGTAQAGGPEYTAQTEMGSVYSQVSTPLLLATASYTDWTDVGIVYTATVGDAYYPSVLFDKKGFGSGTPLYKMWYSRGNGWADVVTSTDGLNWGTPVTLTGLVKGVTPDAHHVQVVYDEACFGTTPCTANDTKYQIWYWDSTMTTLYTINAIVHANSSDGVNWVDTQPISQGATDVLVTGNSTDWNYGSYGPISVHYQKTAANAGTEPWDYNYVMYYDGATGAVEVTGLAYSTDGLFWTAYMTNPVLSGTVPYAWDCEDNAYGTVYRDGSGYHYWYTGSGHDDGTGKCSSGAPVHEGIAYAFSADGKTWTKSPTNPIFHIHEPSAPAYRSGRVYTPAVVDNGTRLRMYYSAQGSSGPKKIGLALGPNAFTSPAGTLFYLPVLVSAWPGPIR